MTAEPMPTRREDSAPAPWKVFQGEFSQNTHQPSFSSWIGGFSARLTTLFTTSFRVCVSSIMGHHTMRSSLSYLSPNLLRPFSSIYW